MRVRNALSAVATLTLLLVSCAGDDDDPADAVPEESATDEPRAEAVVQDGSAYLIVADQPELKLYVYSVPGHSLIAEFDGISVNDHTGFLSLPDGRVLFMDEAVEELVVLQTARDDAEIVARVPAGSGVHLAVDPGLRYAAVSSGFWDDEAGARVDPALTLVDLDSYQPTEIPIETGEPGVALVDDPLRLLHRNDQPARVEVFPVDSVLDGDLSFAEDLPIGPAGHGEAVSDSRGRFYVATDDGVEALDFGAGTLERVDVTPWSASGRDGGRAFYFRMSADGERIVSYVANRAPDQAWGDWENDAYILDLDTNEATRVPLADGYVWRMGIGEDYATYFNLTPIGDAEGDQAHLLDLDADSETFGTVVARVPLPELTRRAEPEPEIWMQPDAEYRRVTMTPDGRYSYITNGGDGTITVIDTTERAIVSTIDTPTALSGGGSLTTVEIGAEFVDTIAR